MVILSPRKKKEQKRSGHFFQQPIAAKAQRCYKENADPLTEKKNEDQG
jgi:hypothetical protein